MFLWFVSSLQLQVSRSSAEQWSLYQEMMQGEGKTIVPDGSNVERWQQKQPLFFYVYESTSACNMHQIIHPRTKVRTCYIYLKKCQTTREGEKKKKKNQ